MKVKDIKDILNIGSDSVIFIHCGTPGKVFAHYIHYAEELDHYEEMSVKELTLSGYGGACLYIDVE